ncbi:Fe-S cluster assembly ATPase SufC [uncultured Slackia sp.]|uniref:Fe-S cluster assembly ATPase SufC n=1 Tax=uncultured Slackia sp. TaxID=665903 RepID=UPI0026DF7BA7|nr:Fe-S cluster assembly ATPase SufC [uncultured Slackia sp.]
MNPDILLSVQGLSASADGKPILRDISLDIPAGQTHVIMGPNGAGKSTFGHVVMGDPAYGVDNGSILLAGDDITGLSPDKRSRAGVFLSFQAPVEIPGVPVSSFLRAQTAGRDGIEMKGKRFRRHIAELAETLEMDPSYLERELGVGFSGGEKKKLEMLQLLLLKPRLAILDETDSGLDVDALGVVSRGIRAYRESCEGTLVIITHNTRILENLPIDRVHVIADGRLVESGDASLVEEIDRTGFERFVRHEDEAAAPCSDARDELHCDHADEGLLGGKTEGDCVAADER